MLYCAASLSLACLELLVHIRDPRNVPVLTCATVSVPEGLIESWNKPRERTQAILGSIELSREIGDEWLNYRSGPLSKARSARPVLRSLR